MSSKIDKAAQALAEREAARDRIKADLADVRAQLSDLDMSALGSHPKGIASQSKEHVIYGRPRASRRISQEGA